MQKCIESPIGLLSIRRCCITSTIVVIKYNEIILLTTFTDKLINSRENIISSVLTLGRTIIYILILLTLLFPGLPGAHRAYGCLRLIRPHYYYYYYYWLNKKIKHIAYMFWISYDLISMDDYNLWLLLTNSVINNNMMVSLEYNINLNWTRR